jgi:hypothetical protein
MKISTAMSILQTDMLFLGMSQERFFKFIKESPGAQKRSVLTAFAVYEKHVKEQHEAS